MAHLCALADDPRIQRATGAKDALSLFATAPSDALWRISDQDLLDFVGTFAASLGSVSDSACADMYPHPGAAPFAQRFMVVAQAVDSATSIRWSHLLEAMVWAGVNKSPRGPEASPAEAQGYVAQQLRTLAPAELADVRKLAASQPLPASAACRAVQRLYTLMALGPTRRAAVALRTLMNGKVPWVAAS
jgi:hypothetical protein